MSYATINDLTQYLGGATLSAANQANGLLALSVAKTAIDTFCQRTFDKDSVASERVFWIENNQDAVWVDDFYSTSGLIVGFDTNDDGVTETTITSQYYQLEPLNGLLNDIGAVPYDRIRFVNYRGIAGIYRASFHVTALWGWSAVPDTIKRVCAALAASSLKDPDTPFGVAGLDGTGISIRVQAALPRFAPLLQPYVRRDLALMVA